MSRPLSVDDVHRRLIERIRSGAFPVGSKLPSVRSLADELGSNPTTVDRALHRLAQMGIVRTVPRQGAYVSTMEIPTVGGGRPSDTSLLEKALHGLRASGMAASDVRELVDGTMETVFSDPKVVFVECNLVDLEQMAEKVTNATGVDLIPMLLADLPDAIDEKYDVIAIPLFHIAELTGVLRDFSKVVELNFQPSPLALRKLAMLDPASRVLVSAPTERGKERMLSLTQQFFLGRVDMHHSHLDDPAVITTYDAVVYTNAAQIDPAAIAKVAHPILIEWELDTSSSSTFLARVGAAAGSSREQTVQRRPALVTSDRDRGRDRPATSASSTVTTRPSTTDRRPATHTSLTWPGPAANTTAS